MYIQRTKLLQSLGVPAALCLLMLTGCGSAKAPAAATANLSGYVRDEAGQAVANAVVANADGTQTATTDASGRYAFARAAVDLGEGALRASASSYSTVFRLVPPLAETQDFVIRHFDTETTVTLPTDESATATVTTARDDGTVTLAIPYQGLVKSDGSEATGDATVRMTYWHPLKDLGRLPTPMVARLPRDTDGNGPYDLAMQTLGMVDVEITQGDEVLQVAPGKNLNLDQVLPARFQQGLAQRPNDMPLPYMFYFDTALSRWILDGSLSYDGDRGTLKAELPHLTIWNFDNFQNWMPPASCTGRQIADGSPGCRKPDDSSVGGCLSGKALRKDGSPYANSTVRLWLIDNENLSAVDLPTNAGGQYCVNIGTRLCVPRSDIEYDCTYTENTVSYFVSGVDSPEDSSMQNPIPNQCLPSPEARFPAISYASGCGLISDFQTGLLATDTPLLTPATATVKVGTYCSSGGCGALPDVTISTDVPKTPGGATPASPCKSYVPAGSPCTATIDSSSGICCADGTICSDYVCLPPLAK